ncbi:beta-glucoside-specific PTS transporter subunit IIABC [Vagococcus acidifermentans]|uniref:PTS system sucrose-specific EIIBCA component n=1 Tax=Vagococcus acidifermentans TaxID=564710 RepID=A0A430AQK7_9ENTE|nr:beta-glucoside-specific PTS transporter subunit IIABC [Vagococcus acidifermentans]RSU10411.1 PTS beta-glucoside transporter subunit EIIBCA [Vagococcus acidifermentans]
MDKKQLAADILSLVGGKQNVTSVIHCATRLRFKLKDESQAKTADIKALDGVIEVVQSSGQYQVVIGNQVKEVYNQLVHDSGLGESDEKEEASGNLVNRVIDIISSIFLPFIGPMAGAGVLKGLLALATTLHWMSPNSGTYQVLFIAADAFFQFLPFALAFTAAKKFKVDPFISLAIAGALLYPGLTDNPLNFMGINIVLPVTGYYSSVIPIILAVGAQIPVERTIRKIVPDFLKTVVAPLLVIAIMVPLTFLVIGPLGTIIGDILGKGYTVIFESSPIIAGLIIGAFWQVLVMFGMHWGFVPITITNLSTLGFDSFTPLLLPAVIAQAGSALAVMVRTKDKKRKQLAGSGTITALFGITEPTIYGVTLPLKKPFIAGCIGGAIGSAVTAVAGVKAFSQVMPSLLVLPAFISTKAGVSSSVFGAILGTGISFIAAFVLTLILGFDTEADAMGELASQTDEAGDSSEVAVDSETLVSPLNGTIVPLEEVDDKVFASGAMGKGIAIMPTSETLLAPADGIVSTLFPTGHAVGITTDSGIEILMHIGIDTVELEGKGFDIHVKQGDAVKQGDLLVSFSLNALKEAGKDATTSIVITNTADFLDVLPYKQTELVTGEDFLTVVK